MQSAISRTYRRLVAVVLSRRRFGRKHSWLHSTDDVSGICIEPYDLFAMYERMPRFAISTPQSSQVRTFCGTRRVTGMKKIITTTMVTLVVLAISISSAQAAINITEATIQNGSVFISGNQAPRATAIWWEGKAIPSTSNNRGAFRFDTTDLPADCVGRLQIGTEQRDVVISNCTPRAAVLKTGQTTCYADQYPTVIPCAGTGQDGEFQKGAVSPVPRFTDNLNGTITDNLTGLIWLKDANCFGPLEWRTAIDRANGLAVRYLRPYR